MRLVIDAPAYTTAEDSFTTANQVAAIQYDALVGKLGSYAGMAGDDSTSAAFATAYDEAVAEALAALADVVPAFANLGRLAGQSAANHREANNRSIITGNVVFDGTWHPASEVVSVLPATPASSLGGDAAAFSDKENWILDHIEGFVWPNADTDRLRDAAHVWRTAADSLDGLTDHCRDAACAFETQRSPEIPIAVAATDELAAAIREVAGQLVAVAGSCEEYAAHVDARRAEIRALLREILQMVVEGLVVSVAIGLITGGAGAVAGTSAVVARVAAQAPRFTAILSALRAAVATSTAYLRTTHAALRASRMRLAKFVNARLAMRNEFGHGEFEDDGLSALRAWVRTWPRPRDRVSCRPKPGVLAAADARRAVAEGRFYLSNRGSSGADDQRGACSECAPDRSVAQGCRQGPRCVRRSASTEAVGEHLNKAGDLTHVTGARAYLVRDSTWADGFRDSDRIPNPLRRLMSTPGLDYLLGTYFHQDFRLVNGGVWETVEAFIGDDPDDASSYLERSTKSSAR